VHIKTLTAQNFRCFENLQIDFQPGFNLLIGNNMSGKTAVLDALRICLTQFTRAIVPAENNILMKDLRIIHQLIGDTTETIQQNSCRVDASIDVSHFLSQSGLSSVMDSVYGFLKSGALNAYQRFDAKKGGGAKDIFSIFASRINSELKSGEVFLLPVLVFFGTSRVAKITDVNLSKKDEEKLGRPLGYLDSLSESSSLVLIRSWIERRTMSEMQRKQRGLPLLEEGPLLGIERAVKICLPELKQFYFDFEFQELTVVFQDDRRLPWMMLSDGMRSLISLAMDIAWRAVVLNPQLGAKAPELATGVVLIDELDLALHPIWQRRIVGDLSRAFPNVQFIATTHSPQIIGSAKNARVQKIDGDKVQTVAHPFGLDSNTLLTEVMGAKERDPQIVALFDKVNALMNDKRWDEARAALARVTDQIDSLDTEVVSLRARIDFLSRAAKRS